MKFFWLAMLSLLLISCTDKGEIAAVLEQRDLSISQKDIRAYSVLISPTYLSEHNDHAINNMTHLFNRFDKVEMKSRDRVIRFIDDNHALCEQTYILRVFADDEWRSIVKREQLKLTLEHGKWKISGGL